MKFATWPYQSKAVVYNVCVVLALDSRNYCSGEQDPASQDCSLLNTAENVNKFKKLLPPYVNPQPHGGTLQGMPQPLTH